MESLYRLKDLLCDQVEEIIAKNDITPTELDRVYKVVDVIKDIVTIDAMENADYSDWDEEASYRGGRSSRNSYRRPYSYDGGYSTRRGYSRAGAHGTYRMSYDDEEMSKEHMMQKINEMQRKIEQM